MNYCPNCRHGKESCQCKQDISYGINEAINTLRVADLQLKQAEAEKEDMRATLLSLMAYGIANPEWAEDYERVCSQAAKHITKRK
jgi:hypothetical protein